MIPQVTSPKITELQTQDARLVISDKALTREIEQLTAKGNQPTAADNASLIAMVLADPDNINVEDDSAAKIKTAWAKRQAIHEARQSLKTKLAQAKHEAGDAILQSADVQKQHAELMKRLTTGFVEVSKAWADLFAMSRELRDREVGFRFGICETMPLDLLGAPNAYSPLADFLNQAAKAGYISAGSVPREYRV
jgi:hypothetical protein